MVLGITIIFFDCIPILRNFADIGARIVGVCVCCVSADVHVGTAGVFAVKHFAVVLAHFDHAVVLVAGFVSLLVWIEPFGQRGATVCIRLDGILVFDGYVVIVDLILL